MPLSQGEMMARLREIGPQIDVPRTAELYAPLQPVEPYAGVAVTRDQAYGSHERQVLDVFTAGAHSARGASLQPVVVFIHGGGFRAGAKRTAGSPFYDNVGIWAATHGLVGITVNYRLAPEFGYPSGADDVAGVVAWLHEYVAQYGGDPQRIFLVGHSAGGAHLATWLQRTAEPRVAGAVLVSGIYDIAKGGQVTRWQDYYGTEVAKYAAMSSLPGLLNTPVPLLVVHAELDRDDFVRDAEGLIAACEAAGRRVRTLLLRGHSHLSEIYAIGTDDDSLTAPLLDFIQNGGNIK